MLVLTRKSDESIMIGDEIEISILAVHGDKVRIGINAPKSVPVFRNEVYDQIHGVGDLPQKGDTADVGRALQDLKGA